MGRGLRTGLLWVDCTAAALAGAVMLSFSGLLAALQGLPQGLLVFIGVMNLLYGCYSFSLARRPRRPLALIGLLVIANLGWACACIAMGVHFAPSATPWGLAQLFGEALFVGGLACFEWTSRDLLRVADGP